MLRERDRERNKGREHKSLRVLKSTTRSPPSKKTDSHDLFIYLSLKLFAKVSRLLLSRTWYRRMRLGYFDASTSEQCANAQRGTLYLTSSIARWKWRTRLLSYIHLMPRFVCVCVCVCVETTHSCPFALIVAPSILHSHVNV